MGTDVSEKSLGIARRRFPGIGALVSNHGETAPFAPGSFDLVYAACVFQHIPPAEHVGIFAELRARLRPGGALVLFEHNPWNPVTRHIVNTCQFDANAVLLTADRLKASQEAGGFARVSATYTAFFPGPLARLRPLERHLGKVPFGAQYYTLAEA